MRILHVDTSPDPRSATRVLSAGFVERLSEALPEAAVTREDLAAAPPPWLDAAWIEADVTPPEALDAAGRAALAESERYIAQLFANDVYVFALPMHNFTVPANFKLWIDHVTRHGRTFLYTAEGPVGLLENKRAVVITARGGYYVEADPQSDFQVGYMKKLLKFIGVTDVAFVHAEGLRIEPQRRDAIMAAARDELAALAAAWAVTRAA